MKDISELRGNSEFFVVRCVKSKRGREELVSGLCSGLTDGNGQSAADKILSKLRLRVAVSGLWE